MANRLVLFTHKGIHYESQTSGEVTAIVVPLHEQVQVFGDIDSPSNQELSQRYGMEGKKILWRVDEGKVIVYGVLDDELQKERKRVKVFLPQDFVSPETTVLFFVMDERWIVHGVKEIDDEKRSEWKLTAYNTRGSSPAKLTLEILTEIMLSGSNEKVVVAVNEHLEILEELKKSLGQLDITPVPFSSLHPGPQKPLYQHGDYGVFLMALLMFAGLMLAGACFYWVANIQKARHIQEEIDQVRDQVAHVQINEHLGYIHEPQQILNTMKKALRQQPSAIIDGVAQFAKQFGELGGVDFQLAMEGNGAQSPPTLFKIGDGQMQVHARLRTVQEKLLVNQEAEAIRVLPLHPWIRNVAALKMDSSTGGGELSVIVQTEKTTSVEEEKTPPSPTVISPTSASGGTSLTQIVSTYEAVGKEASPTSILMRAPGTPSSFTSLPSVGNGSASKGVSQ